MSTDNKLFITADNDLEVYFDGVASEINTSAQKGDWSQTKVAVLPPGTRVIAVKVTNTGGPAGLVASITGDSLVTDESWLCSGTLTDGWNKPDFDDRKWVGATSQGLNDAAIRPWEKRPLISDKAKWIWNRDTKGDPQTVTGVLYFRVHLRTLFITADNDLEVYFDGVASEINTSAQKGDWSQTKVAVLPSGTRVIAVKVTNTGGPAGLLASMTGDSLVTDESWLYSGTLTDGWNKPDFDDSKWVGATSQGLNDAAIQPWEKRPLISDNAKWIWNRDTQGDPQTVTGVLYFRARLGPKLFITADNDMEVYMDGVPSEVNKAAERGDWRKTKAAVLPPGTRVIAVKVTNTGGPAGLLASITGDSLVTDERWRFSAIAAVGWNNPDFDDSKWLCATSQGFNDTTILPWEKRPLISDKAKWIWNRDTKGDPQTVTGVLYFRVRLGSA